MTTKLIKNLWNSAHIVNRILKLRASDFNYMANTNTVNTYIEILDWAEKWFCTFKNWWFLWWVVYSLASFVNKIDILLKTISTTNFEFWKLPILFVKLAIRFDSVMKFFDREWKYRTRAIITSGWLYILNPHFESQKCSLKGIIL